MQLSDLNDALHHLDQAIALYQEWGAHAKVLQLRSAHSSPPLAPPIEIDIAHGDMVKVELSHLTDWLLTEISIIENIFKSTSCVAP